MDGETVPDKLTHFLDCLLGDGSVDNNHSFKNSKKQKNITSPQNLTSKDEADPQNSPLNTKKKGQDKKSNKKENVPQITEKQANENMNSLNNERKESSKKKKIQSSRTSGAQEATANKGFTDDGFKIVSSIPEDDSDVSDAFESGSEAEEEDLILKTPRQKSAKRARGGGAQEEERTTEDGFKIKSEIPPDDSDVSDAFEDGDSLCGDDDEGFTEDKVDGLQRKVKKPIMQIMKDFGLSDSDLLVKRELMLEKPSKVSKKRKRRKGVPNTLTQAAKKKKQQEDVTIINYAQKRGSGKKNPLPAKEDVMPVPAPSKETMDEKELKRVRYDVFKLGMSGFHKEKREDTRVALAIKLGAKPPKNKAVSYKKLLEMKKEEKKKASEEVKVEQKSGHKASLSQPSRGSKEQRRPVKAGTSQIGRYRHGVQVLSKRDLSKINKS